MALLVTLEPIFNMMDIR